MDIRVTWLCPICARGPAPVAECDFGINRLLHRWSGISRDFSDDVALDDAAPRLAPATLTTGLALQPKRAGKSNAWRGGNIRTMPHTDTQTDTQIDTQTAAAARPPAPDWPAIDAARASDPASRLPFWVLDAGQPVLAGSVAIAHLPALAHWPEALRVEATGVTLTVPATQRSGCLAQVNHALQAAGLITGWRSETFPLLPAIGGALLATLERAAARFWGTLTFGAHCNGYQADARGRPSHLWIARRALDKQTDPGLLDNLIGGGVPHGQNPAQTVVREGWEEAGLLPAQMAALVAGRRFRVARDVAEGFQREEISVFDLALPASLLPQNQDGEVHSHRLMTIDQALAHAAAGDMTVDAALATLDFALRQRLLPANRHQHLQALAEGLWVGRTRLAC
jgi:8-oxo-dGTP pyrophosphatase MutT (NUDIX family)